MDIIHSIMMGVGRKAVCTAIDPLAKDKADEYFNEARVKIMMRDALMQANPELANSPQLKPNPGEPENLEELEMQMNYGFKFNMAMEAEQGIELVHYQNKFPEKRSQVCTDIRIIGVGGYKDWLDENGKPKYRTCDPAMVIMSNCVNADFSDKRYVGEVTEVPVGELSQYFDKESIKIIQKQATNKNVYTSPTYSTVNDKANVAVLDLEIKTWNSLVFSRMINKFGNEEYMDRPYENIVNPARSKELSNIPDSNGNYKPKYFSKSVECWYKIKWIIGTDYYYLDGKVSNQKRPKDSQHLSESSYHFRAVNFHKMTAQGLMERLKPIIDEYQLTIFKIQDFKNKWLPYLIEIDLDALESTALGGGGVNWTPEKIMELAFQTRALIVRKKDIRGININYKAIEIHQTGMAAELQPLMADLARLLQEMNDVTGLNPVTDATGAGDRKGKAVAQFEAQATNNALQPLMFTEKMIFESLSKGCIERLIQAVKMGKIDGVMTALGGNTVKFIQVSPDISLYAWGIKVQDIPTDDDIQMIMEQLGVGQAKNLLRPQDIFMIRNLDNLKQMEQLIGYLYEKRVKEEQQYEMSKIKEASKGNQETVIVAEKAKQETLAVEYSLKTQFETAIKGLEKELLAMKLAAEAENNRINAQAKVVSSEIAGQRSIEKQEVANEKAESRAVA
jgi:23S rRNA pseudoU1915 N3-methylase RlmH